MSVNLLNLSVLDFHKRELEEAEGLLPKVTVTTHGASDVWATNGRCFKCRLYSLP